MAPKASKKTDYVHLQNEEIEALKAIYLQDFEEIEVKGPWSGSSEKVFRLHLKPLSNPDIGLVISVKFTATYPKTPPILNIENVHNIREKSIDSIKRVFQNKPNTLLGSVMIFEIASDIMDILVDEEEFQAQGAALPTLEEERAGHEALAARLAKEQKIKDLELKEHLKAEADKAMQQLIDEEISKGRELGRRKSVDPLALAQGTSSVSSMSLRLFSVCLVFDSSNYLNRVITSVFRIRQINKIPTREFYHHFYIC
jgi:eukaryotic translation initiation factor 2-alpha kinase 4